MIPDVTLPVGCELRVLEPHVDRRGSLVEFFRGCWPTRVAPVQWSLLRSLPGTLRGVHVHPRHDDYLVIAEGRTTVGLRDLRRGSPSEGRAVRLDFDGRGPVALSIPHGVAHGFLYHEPNWSLLGASEYWDPADEIGCRYDDPGLGIDWGLVPAITSGEREGPFMEMVAALEPFQPIAWAAAPDEEPRASFPRPTPASRAPGSAFTEY